MNTLYPIGTVLTTRRLSQAALYIELFGHELISFVVSSIMGDIRLAGSELAKTQYWASFKRADVTVTPENQQWLSPVPMVGDFWSTEGFGDINGILIHERHAKSIFFEENRFKIGKKLSHEPFLNIHLMMLESRGYPNGQREPLIKWDEVILPNEVEK